MAKNNNKNKVLGVLSGIQSTNKMQEAVEEVAVSTTDKNEEVKEVKKSTRGRKKQEVKVSLEFKGSKLKIKKQSVKIEKVNKTFYLESTYIAMLEDLSSKTGMTTSELVQAAIQLLNNNVELEGFED